MMLRNFGKYLSSFSLIICVILGGLIGLYMGKSAEVFAPIGTLFVNIVFTLVVPLICTSVIRAISSMESTARLGKVFGVSMLVFLVTSLLSSLIMVAIVFVIPAAQKMDLPFAQAVVDQSKSLADILVTILSVSDFVSLFSRTNMLAMIIIAGGVGFAALLSGKSGEPFTAFIESANTVLIRLSQMVMKAAPIGLGAYFATLTGRFGETLVAQYLTAAGIYWISGIFYILIMFSLYAWIAGGNIGFRRFWGAILPTAITAISTCSSAVSLPANLHSAKTIGVPHDIANTCIPLGTSIHKQGAARCGVLFSAFLFGVFNQTIHTPTIFFALLAMGLLISVIMGAMPNGGAIVEVVIISTLGFPIESLPLLIVLHSIVDPLSTVINACGNTVNSMIIARIVDGKAWLSRHRLSPIL